MNWTESQREAIETRGRRVIVSAGAGSGKTRVLVERFLRLLEENPGWRVSDIVAVTFTEKAAREMVSRIRREIRSRIEESTSSEAKRRWRERRNQLDSARIGTIHSLCSSILRAHPAEAELDPAFDVIVEVEAAAALEQAIEEAISQAARDAQADSSEIEIFTYLTPYEVKQALRSLIGQGERARRAVEKLAGRGADEIAKVWERQIRELRFAAARALVERESWKRDSDTINRLAALDPADKREQCRAQVADLLRAATAGDDRQCLDALLEIASCITLLGGSKKKWASEEELKLVTEALRRVREAVRSEKLLALELNEADQAAARATHYLIRLYGRVRACFAALKAKRARLDFNDLEEMTERMLRSHPEVAGRYSDPDRGLLRALMIDEFQDTSPIQKRILWAIAPRSSEMFIIGDAKQSIYRFRGADVTVFHDARQEFRSAGDCSVGMDTCFRTHHRLVDFVNHVFPKVFTCESRYDTAYEAMRATRAPMQASPAIELHIIAQGKEDGERLSADELRVVEAALIARRIRQIIAEGEVMICDERARPRRVEFGDFALLFQASTSFEIYEQALSSASIPYVTTAGRGFYDRQEIADLGNLLAFLASPIDSLRLASVLRSPMFALSDETLFRLRLRRRSLWESLCDESVKLSEDEGEAARFARESLKRLRQIVGRVSPARVITAALDETGYLATLAALPHGERRTANVEKFIEQAHAFRSMTLSEMVKRIADLKFTEAREGEATIEEAGAVRLMTVHKSKGLEFPIVWIADATYAGGRDRDIVATHPEYGICVEASAVRSDYEDASRSASFELIKLVEAQMDRAEKKRLFYVAATRARDHLIISGAVGRAKLQGEHWIGQITTALDMDESERASVADYPGGRVAVVWHEGKG
jgi:ATP-dependent helicase/nuclease subunit A